MTPNFFKMKVINGVILEHFNIGNDVELAKLTEKVWPEQ